MLIVKSQLVFILSDPTSSSVPTTEMFKLVILLLLFGSRSHNLRLSARSVKSCLEL